LSQSNSDSGAQAYLARSERYIYRPQDSSIVRFAEMGTKGIASRAVIRDLSDTGLAFMIERSSDDFTLDSGDMLKIEFTVPGRRQIACFTTVMRVEERSEWDAEWGQKGFLLIALQFRQLPQAHLRAIREGLKNQSSGSSSMNSVMEIVSPYPSAQTNRHSAHAVAFIGWSAALAFALYAMALSPADLLHMVKF
jgi:hypothetical protein